MTAKPGTAKEQSKQDAKNPAPVSPLKVIFGVFVAALCVYFFLQFLMNGMLVEFEERQEFGSGTITKMECGLVDVANLVTERNVVCVHTKSN